MLYLHGPGLFRSAAALAVALLLLGTPLAQAQITEPLTGSFTDGFLTIHISGQNGQYSGQFEAGGRTYPFTAAGGPQQLDGTYRDDGQLWQFSAVLQGDSLTFQNSSQTFQLTRVGAAQSAPATTGGLPAGTRLTYSLATSSRPGTDAGPDARGVAAQGFVEIDVLYSDSSACVASMTSYIRGLTVDTLAVTGTEYIVSDGNSCTSYWMAPSALAAYQAPPGGIETVERGPYQLGSDTYNALYVNSVYQDMRSWRVYDLNSGMLLSFTEGTGTRNPDGTTQGTATSSVQELVNVRQLDQSWAGPPELPAHLHNLQSLSYSGQLVESMPAITGWDTSTTAQVDSHYTVRQRNPAWLQMQVQTSMSIMGAPVPPEARQVVATAGTGHFLPPAQAAQLSAGQVLDTDPVTGYRKYVERADQDSIVLVIEGRGYRLISTYDPGSGIMVRSRSEAQQEQTMQTITVDLTGWQ